MHTSFEENISRADSLVRESIIARMQMRENWSFVDVRTKNFPKQHYTLILVPGHEIEFQVLPMLRPRYGLPMTLHPRLR